MLQPVDINKGLETVEKSLNNLTSTDDERDVQLSMRHAADMASNSWLAKAIRPILAIYYSLIYGATTILAIILSNNDPIVITAAIAATGTIVTSIIGFYFTSRKAEKLADKKAASDADALELKLKASLEIEKLRLKHELDMEMAKHKVEIKEEKQELKEDKKEAREERRERRRNS